MPVDARPFLTLSTAAGSIKCGRPKVVPLSVGLARGAQGIVADNPTHTIKVYTALGMPPTDLADNAVVYVDVEKNSPAQRFRVLRRGIDRAAGIWTLYVLAEDAVVQELA